MKIFKKPETMMIIGIVGGVLIGIGADNIGLGIALGLVLGISGYSSRTKKEKEKAEVDESE